MAFIFMSLCHSSVILRKSLVVDSILTIVYFDAPAQKRNVDPEKGLAQSPTLP